MEILPVLNSPDEKRFEERLALVKNFLPAVTMVHIDVADGSFTRGYQTWITPEKYTTLFADRLPRASLHIMSDAAEQLLSTWMAVKPARFILHLESLKDPKAVALLCRERGVEVYLAMTLKTDIDTFFACVSDFDGALVLAVDPGLSGQEFQPAALLQIAKIRERLPSLPICVDGGVSSDVVAACAKAGATELAVGAHIFRQNDPAAAYGGFVQLAKE